MVTVAFHEVSPSGSTFHLDTIEGLEADTDIKVVGPVQGRCVLTRNSAAAVECSGTLRATVEMQCDRCLATLRIAVDSPLHIVFDVTHGNNLRLKDVACTEEDLDITLLEQPLIDLNEMFREQLLLALPASRLCDPDCKGLCPHCGVDRNTVGCACREDGATSPFAILANIKRE